MPDIRCTYYKEAAVRQPTRAQLQALESLERLKNKRGEGEAAFLAAHPDTRPEDIHSMPDDELYEFALIKTWFDDLPSVEHRPDLVRGISVG